MKREDAGAVPATSTIYRYKGSTPLGTWRLKLDGLRAVVDGGELGSTALRDVGRGTIGTRKVTADLNVNDNEPATALRLAA